MYYVIGPERSCEAMARKFGLRPDEWKRVMCATDVMLAPVFDKQSRFLVTHDARREPGYQRMIDEARILETMFEDEADEIQAERRRLSGAV